MMIYVHVLVCNVVLIPLMGSCGRLSEEVDDISLGYRFLHEFNKDFVNIFCLFLP